jgi:hypothetical protein
MNYLGFKVLVIATAIFQQPVNVEELIKKTDGRQQPMFFAAEMRLIYRANSGEVVNERTLKYWRNWNSLKSEMTLLKFMKPIEVRNTAFLTKTYNEKTEHIVYLPDLGRLRTLKQAQLNTSFMNSDFYYSDLKSWELALNDNQLLEESEDYYSVESNFKKAFYNQRLILKIDKKTFFIEEVQFFKKGCDLPIRIMKILDKRNVDGIVYPVHLRMTQYYACNNEIKSSSEIIFYNVDVKSKISESIYTKEFMIKPL